ncbi:IS4 family transposase [Xanthomonas sp. WHRI 1810A]|uniref:IS4 family transposase n=1 Tax=Xanthomonas sp. WHRI 1810A TaxID=3161565 RepID=UPI0032E9221B
MFSNTHLGQLLTAFPTDLFQREVKNSKADRYAKCCTSRDLLVTLLLGHLQQANSLRSLTTMSQAIDEHQYHLNAKSIPRSTLSDALNKRSVLPFQKTAEHLLKCIGGQQSRSLGRMISLIDSTSITLRGPGFDEWTLANKTRITQGLKIHTGFDPVQLAPTYINITPANINDMTDALKMPIQPGMTYVFDKGYCDYGWWHELHAAGAYFVTRLKSNANVRLSHRHSSPASGSAVRTDEIVQFGRRQNAFKDAPVRRISVSIEDWKNPLTLITNDMTSPPEEIADLYKQRWQIELFFKWIKQHLKLKRFYGFSENAVRLQIYTAVITYLLLHILQRRSGLRASLFDLTRRLSCVWFERPLTRKYQTLRRQNIEKLKAAQGSLQL